MSHRQSVEVHVATTGNDQNPGSAERPVATLAGARDRVRALRHSGDGAAVEVWIHGGNYELAEPLVLTAEDAGSEGAAVIYRAWPREVVRVSGGRRVSAERFEPLRDEALRQRLEPRVRQRVLQLDLAAVGVSDVGEAVARGFWFPRTPAEVELFCDDRPLPMARWPREGYARVGAVVEPGTRSGEPDPRGAVFTGDSQRIARWSRPADLRCFGLWKHAWAPATMPVAALDTQRGLIHFACPSHYGVFEGRDYCVLNAVEEIAEPGDWALDRAAGLLYVYPTDNWSTVPLMVSRLGGPLIELRGTSHVTIRDLIFEGGRGNGVEISGHHNLIAHCVLRNFGGRAVNVTGEHNSVRGCDIYQTGQGGILLSGGDRRTLTPAGHVAENNDIHDFNRICVTYNAGIEIQGVGQRALHNHIHNGPHNGILLGGNDHVIAYNEIDHMAMGTDDAAAIYMGRRPSEQGNVIEYNFFHHVGTPSGWGTSAIYPDDGESGFTIRGNVFYRCGHAGQVSMGAVFINAGKDHLIEQNLFVDCRLAVGLMLPTQQGWERTVARDGDPSAEVWRDLYQSVDIDSPLYRSRYPQLADLAKNASRNTLRGNLAVRCGRLVAPEERQVLIDNYEIDADPGFADMDRLDFRFRRDKASRASERFPGFVEPPIEQMGLRVDADRSFVPPRDLIDCKVEVLARPVVSRPGQTATARIAIKLANLSPERFIGTVVCWTNEPDCVAFTDGATHDFDVPPMGVVRKELTVTVTARPDARLTVGARLPSRSPFFLPEPLRPEYRCEIDRLAEPLTLDTVAEALQASPPLVLLRQGENVGEVRLALDPQHVALYARVTDKRITPAAPLWIADGDFWGGPYVGILVAKPDARTTRQVRQVILFPHGPGPAGTAWQFNGHEQVTPEAVRWKVCPRAEGGYEITALVPLAALGLDDHCDSLLLEAMANALLDEGGKPVTTTLFGSRTAQLEVATLAHCRVNQRRRS